MLRNKLLIGIMIPILLLIFSVPGFTAYYKYTQESGANFYVGTADKSDALEDTNEMRQIIDDLGALLAHSKRDDSYPEDLTTGGTIQIPEAGLKFSNDPVNDDIAAYIAGEMTWQTKAELGIDLSLYYLKTEIDSLSEIETIYTKDITDSDELASALTDYYLKTAIDTLGEVEAIYVKDIIDSDELAALEFTDLTDTPANYTDQAGKYVKVNAGETALEFGTPAGGGTYLELTDTPIAYDNGKYAKSTADGVVWDDPAGAGDMTKATYDTDEDSDIDVAAGGTEKSAWTLYAIPYLSGTTAFGEISIGTAGQVLKVSAGATEYEFADESDPTVDSDAEIKAILSDEVTKTSDFTAGRMAIINNASGIIEQGTNTDTDVADAVTKKHTQNTDTILVLTNALSSDQTYSGETDSQLVGETVAFGEILYFNWTDKEWKKAKADAFATAYGTRIALEAKNDGQTCLMLVKGYIREDTLFDFGAVPVFLNDDTAGTCDDTAPAESGDQIFKVGEAKSADILFFDPGKDVGEI